MKTKIYYIALMAVATSMLAACTSTEESAIDKALADGTIVPATFASVGVNGTTSSKAATSRATTTTQPNTVFKTFAPGDVFNFNYVNALSGYSQKTVYAKLQNDGTTWKTYSDEACTTEQTIYLDAKDEQYGVRNCFFKGFNGDVPEGQNIYYTEDCYITKQASDDVRGAMVCYDILKCDEPTVTVLNPTSNERKSTINVEFSHENYLLNINIAKVDGKSTLQKVNTVTIGLRERTTSALDGSNEHIHYYDVAATAIDANAASNGVTSSQWRVILPPRSTLDATYEYSVASITIKGTIADGSEWTYTIDLGRIGQRFSTKSGSSRTVNIKVAEQVSLILGATVEGWTAVDSGAADVTRYDDTYDFAGLTADEITAKLSELKTLFKGLPNNCVNLTIKNLTTLPERAFDGCYSISSVNLPDAVTIGDCAFLLCNSITSVNLPNATTIEKDCFNYCTSLSSIKIPNATTIGSDAFLSCSKLTSIDLPKVTSIGERAFYGCSLTSAKLTATGSISIASNGFWETNTIDLTLNSNKSTEVTDSYKWGGYTWKAINFVTE